MSQLTVFKSQAGVAMISTLNYTIHRIGAALGRDRNNRIAMVSKVLLVGTLLVLGACGDSGKGKNTPPPPASANPDQDAFHETVHPLLVQYCGDCHAGQFGNAPKFAVSDVASAYDVLVKGGDYVNLANPVNSTIVKRVKSGHKCWNDDCAKSGDELAAAISAWSTKMGNVPPPNSATARTLKSASTTLAAGKTSLRFDISAASGIAGSAIEFQASELDISSYVLSRPTYVGTNPPSGLKIKGIRVAINDRILTVGQAFQNIDTNITSAQSLLSEVGTVIAKDSGPATDSFVLVFEQLGSKSDIIADPSPGALPVPTDTRTVVPDNGVRTFEQIRDTMAKLTGVGPTVIDTSVTPNVSISNIFDKLKLQLPRESSLLGFSAGNQMVIASLAAEYCNAMMQPANAALRSAFFNDPAPATTFQFDTSLAVAFGAPVLTDPANLTRVNSNLVINPLINKMIGINLSNQPIRQTVYNEVNALIEALIPKVQAAVFNPPIAITDPARTRNVVTGACAAVLSSAALMVH